MSIDVALLTENKLFGLLSQDDRKALASVVDYKRLTQGQILFETGAPSKSLFIVRSGEIELFVNDTAGKKIPLRNAGAGDFFGELALLDGGPRTATAAALVNSELLILNREGLFSIFQQKPNVAINMLAALSGMVRRTTELARMRVSRNVNDEMKEGLSLFQRIADLIAQFFGSVYFLSINIIWFIAWILVNATSLNLALGVPQFDPFPFGLLTMIVSLEAIFLSCFVLISQNRQEEKDRLRSDNEYNVNIRAEEQIAYLHEKTDHNYAKVMWQLERLENMIAKEVESRVAT